MFNPSGCLGGLEGFLLLKEDNIEHSTATLYISRLLHARHDAGRGEGAGPEVHPGHGQADGHVPRQAPDPVDRSLRRYRGELNQVGHF